MTHLFKARSIALVFIICFCLTYIITSAQQYPEKNLSFQSLTINDGLSQGMVNWILQDHYGFMWFATKDGLNRYDGYHFTVFRHDARDSSTIADNFVQSMFEDSKGRLWTGTASGGLNLFVNETETFIHITHRDDDVNSLSPGAINQITGDKQGNIWVRVLDKLDKITVNEKAKRNEEKFLVEHIKVPFAIRAPFLFITQFGKIYCTDTEKGMIYTLDDEKKMAWSLAFDPKSSFKKPGAKDAQIPMDNITVEDKTSQKFYLFYNTAVICFDEKKGTPEKMFPIEINAEYEAAIDTSGTIWFSNTGDSLAMLNTKTGELKYAVSTDAYVNRCLHTVYPTYIDRSGIVWVGTKGYGLLKYNARTDKFHHTDLRSILVIKQADDGRILISYDYNNYKVFDNATGSYVKTIPIKQAKVYFEDFNEFSYITVTDNKGTAWFGNEKRLVYYDKISKRSVYFPLPVVSTTSNYGLTEAIAEDADKNIWLGTTEGLIRFKTTDASWKIYKNIPNDSSSLSFGVIFSLRIDPLEPGKYLWIGTDGGGLDRMDITTGKCIAYTVKDGLPNDVIYGILNDDDGNLWVSTNNGLSCFNIKKQTFKNFEDKDGLQSNEFNRNAYCRTNDGWLFFGGVNGFNYFNPREITNNTFVPQIVITDLKIRNKSVSIGRQNSPLTKAVYLTREITLPYRENMISFEFASMDFTDPEKNLYQYKLEGFDKEWIQSGIQHSATYTNLDPGSYTFRVKGSNSDGLWNEAGTFIQLVILPPWYMTWWFRATLAIMIISATYSFYRYRLAQALKLQTVRNRIASDLHDEIGSNLSNISIFSTVAQQKPARENDLLLKKISEYTQVSMDAMNDIVWMINARNDRFENIFVRMRSLAAEIFEAKHCALHIELDDKLNSIKLSMEKRRNFYLIYKEAINNTAKYAECKDVWIDMHMHHNELMLYIKDNGNGFDVMQRKNGNGIFNMQQRADMLNGKLIIISRPGEGTSMELRFEV